MIKDDKAHLQNVTMGPTLDSQSVVVADALKPGMQIAVDGIDALEDGVAVRVVEPAQAGR